MPPSAPAPGPPPVTSPAQGQGSAASSAAPASSAGPSSAAAPPPQENAPEPSPGTPRRQLKVEDALAYLEKVKSQFADQLAVYNKFLDIMKEFKAQTIDTTEVIRRVSDLFRGHKDLILGFNTFLPPGYKIQVTENRATGALSAGFLGPDGFSPLPTYRKVTTPKAAAGSSGTPRAPGSKRSSAQSTASPKRKDHKKGATSQTPASADVDLQDDIEPAPREGQPSSQHHPSSKAAASSSNAKPSHSRQTSVKPPPEDEVKSVPTPASNSAAEPLAAIGEMTEARTQEFERAIDFITRIKERFSDSPDLFSSFLAALSSAREQPTSIRQVFEAVAEVFGPHKDLLGQFKEFIPTIATGAFQEFKPATSKSGKRAHGGKVTGNSTPPNRKGGAANGASSKGRRPRDMKFFEGIKAQLGPSKSHLYNDFIKCLRLLSQGIVSREELLHLTGEILAECPDAHHAFLSYLDTMTGGEASLDGENEDSSSGGEEEEPAPVDAARMGYYLSKPMSEIASENGHQRMWSYRHMPYDFPKLHYSGRSALERLILNDVWINVTTGSEDYRFMRKNNYEDNLFRCEDDRYELDMVIGSNAATITKLETILGTMSKLSPNEKKRHALAAGALSPVHFNAIRRIYGDSGDEMVQQVKINPAAAVPVILFRMKNKDRSWRKARAEMNKVWRDVGERNYHRSLDHRSSFFKTVDKKDLSVKSLLMDILDPQSSIAAREAEMTRARSYAIPKGAGGTNDHSGASKAVMDAASVPKGVGPRRLKIEFQRAKTHKIVFDLIKMLATEDSTVDTRSTVDQFGKFLEEFFDVDLKEGTRRNLKASKRSDEDQYGRISSVLYGDEPIYLMLRLYHILYERVLTAQNLAEEQTKDILRRKKLNEDFKTKMGSNSHLPNVVTKPWMFTRSSQSEESESGFVLYSHIEDPEELFEEFMKILHPFVRGKLEPAKFEDKCRWLLGTNAYTVFTLDKVLQRTMKQVTAVYASDPTARKMMRLLDDAVDALDRSDNLNGNLDGFGAEELHSIEASRLISDRGTSGLHMFRICREYLQQQDAPSLDGKMKARRPGKKAYVIMEVSGHVEDERRRTQRALVNEEIDKFLGFCASFGDCLHKEEDEESDRMDESDNGQSKDEAQGSADSMSLGNNDNRGSRKRARFSKRRGGKRRRREATDNAGASTNRGRYEPNFLRFRPKRAVAEKRVLGTKVENGIMLQYRSPGYFYYARDTEDFMMFEGRKRKRMEGEDVRAMNEENRWTKKFRLKFKLDSRSFVGQGGGGGDQGEEDGGDTRVGEEEDKADGVEKAETR